MANLFSTDRPEFLERLSALAGSSTYRMPGGGRGTKLEHLPDAHAIAAALSMARQGPDDIGPDVAYSWAVQSDAHRERVTRRLSVMLRSHRFRTLASHRLVAANAAWQVMIHNERVTVKLPATLRPVDWDRLLLAAIALLQAAAWDTLAEAERRYSLA